MMHQHTYKRLTAGKFSSGHRQRSKDSKKSERILSNEQASEGRVQPRNPMINNYLTQTLQQQKAAGGVIHNQPRAGNASFRSIRSISQRGSVGATAGVAACMKPRTNSRNVTSGSGIVASASAYASEPERPATSRVHVRPSQQSTLGCVTARAEQASASVIGPKILSQSKTQSLITIQYPKAPDVLLTEGNMMPSSIQ